MKLTDYSDYALRVLIYLSIQDERLATIKEISEQYGISKNHLMKLVHDLGKHGYIETIRGKNGGLRIARSPEKITAGEIVRIMEKDMSVVECLGSGNSHCRIIKACVLSGAVQKALDAFLAVLDGYTIADLLQPNTSYANLFPQDVWTK